jgi:hypothetical protein
VAVDDRASKADKAAVSVRECSRNIKGARGIGGVAFHPDSLWRTRSTRGVRMLLLGRDMR